MMELVSYTETFGHWWWVWERLCCIYSTHVKQMFDFEFFKGRKITIMNKWRDLLHFADVCHKVSAQ